jgi:quercetin dioxygenase-like cupin family protein
MLGVAGYEQHGELWAQRQDGIGKLQAVHSGHHYIAEQQCDFKLMFFENPERFFSVLGIQHAVPCAFQVFANQSSNGAIIVGDQNCFARVIHRISHPLPLRVTKDFPLWARLAQRIAGETGEAPVLPLSQQPAKPEWEEVAPGISCQLLATDTEKDRVSMLVRLAPGADYPPHRHVGAEELYLLHGELMIDDKKLYPGDYVRAEAGSVDHRVWSETGCTCVLLTSTTDVIL